MKLIQHNLCNELYYENIIKKLKIFEIIYFISNIYNFIIVIFIIFYIN